MPDSARLEVGSDHNFGAVGRTRSGKSYLMQHLTKQQKNVIVVDTKHDVAWSGFHMTTDAETAVNADVSRIVFRVPAGTKIPNDWWMRAVRKLAERGGGVVYIDELPMLVGPNSIPDGLADAFRTANGLGVGIWWSAQEAVGVNNTCIRQSRVLALFNNHGASDRDKLIVTVGDMGEVTKDLAKFEFVVYYSDATYNPSAIPILTLDNV